MQAMVSLAMKRKAERRLRQLIAEDGLVQPEEVEYGPKSITLFWHSVKKSINVDVTETGEVGQSRYGPPSPKWAQRGSADDDRVVRLATLREKRAAEQSARAMLDDHGLPQPDEVQYGATCIRLLWHEEKFALIVDIDDPVEASDAVGEVRAAISNERVNPRAGPSAA